jgi:hypothetical protein
MKCQETKAKDRKRAWTMLAACCLWPVAHVSSLTSTGPGECFFRILGVDLVRGNTELHRACPDYQGIAPLPLTAKMLSYNNLRQLRASCTTARKTARRCTKRRNRHHNRPDPESFLSAS